MDGNDLASRIGVNPCQSTTGVAHMCAIGGDAPFSVFPSLRYGLQ